MIMRYLYITALNAMLAMPVLSWAADQSFTILFHNKQLAPEELVVPSGIRVKIQIQNLDNLPFEFESYDLSRELVIPEHGKSTLFIGPLRPGTYRFFNDFNHDIQGTIKAVSR